MILNLQELQEEERKLNETISSESKKIKELETVGRDISEIIKEIRDLAEQSLMFGHPRDPRFQSTREVKDETKLDFTNVADRIVNYQNHQAWKLLHHWQLQLSYILLHNFLLFQGLQIQCMNLYLH